MRKDDSRPDSVTVGTLKPPTCSTRWCAPGLVVRRYQKNCRRRTALPAQAANKGKGRNANAATSWFLFRYEGERGAVPTWRTLLPGSLTRMPTNMRLQGQSATRGPAADGQHQQGNLVECGESGQSRCQHPQGAVNNRSQQEAASA